jgi:putative hydrolase of the HAD superfamily
MFVEAVLFDADGVIQTTAQQFRSRLAALCGDEHRSEEFLEDLFAAERPCLTGEGDFNAALTDVLGRWNSRSSLEEALAIWQLIEPREDLLVIVDRLRSARVRTGLATNQQPERARYMTENLGYADRFDELLFSCAIGHAKPDPKYFDRVLEILDLEGDKVLFLDDHVRNVEVARGCGLRAEVYDQATGSGVMIQLLADHGLAVAGN